MEKKLSLRQTCRRISLQEDVLYERGSEASSQRLLHWGPGQTPERLRSQRSGHGDQPAGQENRNPKEECPKVGEAAWHTGTGRTCAPIKGVVQANYDQGINAPTECP